MRRGTPHARARPRARGGAGGGASAPPGSVSASSRGGVGESGWRARPRGRSSPAPPPETFRNGDSGGDRRATRAPRRPLWEGHRKGEGGGKCDAGAERPIPGAGGGGAEAWGAGLEWGRARSWGRGRAARSGPYMVWRALVLLTGGTSGSRALCRRRACGQTVGQRLGAGSALQGWRCICGG